MYIASFSCFKAYIHNITWPAGMNWGEGYSDGITLCDIAFGDKVHFIKFLLRIIFKTYQTHMNILSRH